MIEFLKIQQQTTIYLRKIVQLLKWSMLLPLVVSESLLAENHFMFPSDVLDKSERMHLEREGSDRYATQREWSYPEDSGSRQPGNQRPGKSAPHYPEHYITIDGQPVPPRFEAGYSISGYPESDHYKYDDFNTNTSSTYPTDFGKGSSPSSTRTGDYQYDARKLQQYPAQVQSQSFNQNERKSQIPFDSSYPQPEYAQDKYDERIERGHTNKSYPNLLFPGDIEVEKQFMHPKYRRFNSQQLRQRSPQVSAQSQIRYVPVPVYGVPGTLPGTIPGVVTPGNMVPGYSHLSPNNYSGFNNFPGSPYMQVNPFSNFLYPGSPLAPFPNNYGNNSFNSMPFTYPNYMVPGLSVPGIFPMTR